MLGKKAGLVAVVSLIAGGAMAQQPVTWALVSVEPWSFQSAQGEATSGIGVEIIREIARRSGSDAQIQLMPQARMVQRVKEAGVDLALNFRSAAATEFSQFPACLFETPIIAAARVGVPLKAFDDLTAMPLGVGVIRGATYGAAFDTNPNIRRSEETDFPQMIRKLGAGRLNAVTGSSLMVRHYAKADGLTEALGDTLVLARAELCVQVPTAKADSPATLATVAAVKAMAADGWARAVVTRYVGPGWE